MRRAARQTLVDEFVCALPEGYDTIGRERGSKLTGGQRQRIALARAVLLAFGSVWAAPRGSAG